MENNKRKGKDVEKDTDEVEEEEIKIDKFYAMLRRFRDARDRRRKELEELEKTENKKRKLGTQQQSTVWVPSFEWEDFTNDVEFRAPPLRFPTTSPSPSPSPSPRGTHKRKNDQHLHDSLDLNLAL